MRSEICGGLMMLALWAIVLLGVAGAAADTCVVIYLSDQEFDAIWRIEDLNGDGDALDEGEVIIFCDANPATRGIENSQGIVLGGRTYCWPRTTFDPVNMVQLEGLDGDGDAEDAIEVR